MKIGIGITPTSTSFVQTLKREKKKRRRTPVPTRYSYTFYQGRESSGTIYYDGNIGLRVGTKMFSTSRLERDISSGEYRDGNSIMNVDRNSTITSYTGAFSYSEFDGRATPGILYYGGDTVLGVGVAVFSDIDLRRIASGGIYNNRSNRMTVDRNGIITDYR